MKTWQATVGLIVALLLGTVAQSVFSQEVCKDGSCQTSLPSMVSTAVSAPVAVAKAPVRFVGRVFQKRPVRKFVSSRPVRRVVSSFRCR